MSDNPLVDKSAHTDFSDYSALTRNGDGSVSFTPVMGGPGATDDDQHWLSGIPIWDSEQSLVQDIQNNDTFNAVLDGAATALETAGLVAQVTTDVVTLNVGGLVGNLIAAPITAWILDHVKPLRLVMDELLGNPGTVAGVATTWTNMGKALATAATGLQQAAGGTSEYWQGAAAEAYRDGRADKLAKSLGSCAALCQAWSTLLGIVGDCVKILHDTVRDLIAALVAALVELGVNCIVLGPEAAVVEFGIEAPADVIRVTTVVSKLLLKLVDGLTEGISVAGQILNAISELAKLGKAIWDTTSGEVA